MPSLLQNEPEVHMKDLYVDWFSLCKCIEHYFICIIFVLKVNIFALLFDESTMLNILIFFCFASIGSTSWPVPRRQFDRFGGRPVYLSHWATIRITSRPLICLHSRHTYILRQFWELFHPPFYWDNLSSTVCSVVYGDVYFLSFFTFYVTLVRT